MRYFGVGLIALLVALNVSTGRVHAQGVEVDAGVNVSAGGDLNIGYFYDQLAPHGKWVEVADIGWAWQPNEVVTDTEWRPYLNNGHWIYTDDGWFWDSSYEWGWAAFHYGRWNHVDNYNWVWTPDTVWAPAWVSWRESDSVYGWAPLPHGSRFEGGVFVGGADLNAHADFYNFVPANGFLSVNLNTVIVKREERERVFQQTKVVNNSYTYNNNHVVNNGVPVAKVSAATKKEIKAEKIADAQKPGERGNADGKVNAYRPQIKNDKPAAPPAAAQRAADPKAPPVKPEAAKPNEAKTPPTKPEEAKAPATPAKPEEAKAPATPAKTDEAKRPAPPKADEPKDRPAPPKPDEAKAPPTPPKPDEAKRPAPPKADEPKERPAQPKPEEAKAPPAPPKPDEAKRPAPPKADEPKERPAPPKPEEPKAKPDAEPKAEPDKKPENDKREEKK